RNTIRNNTCAAWGGAIVTGGWCNAIIKNNRIENNTADLGGGAAWFTRSGTPTFVDNHVEGNSGPYGGAIFVDLDNTPIIERNLFRRNDATVGTGGAIRVSGAGGQIRQNLIRENSSPSGGGGVAVDNADPCSITGNSIVKNDGGGVHVFSLYVTLERNIIANHPSGSGVVANGVGSWSCNDVWNNSPANYVGVADPTGSDGNISADPLFCSGNLNLSISSPCTAENSPSGCGLIGALPAACEQQVVRVESVTWGQIKSMYR
ncbi:MAG TPA: right-handed parallel beta-helix repeat-containing protein, partial [Candidatus Krumholzibacteria bacterium]|nr:right-handed parallel beta-helix repeat-containing protein [Candidatus Krumholzibacteria bacterium]